MDVLRMMRSIVGWFSWSLHVGDFFWLWTVVRWRGVIIDKHGYTLLEDRLILTGS